MIVYTAIFHDYDALREVKLPFGWEAVCFTDKPIKSKSWDVRVLEPFDKIHRRLKIIPEEQFPGERTIWIDGNLEYLGDWKDLDRRGFNVMKHPERQDIHQEAQACIWLRKDDRSTIIRQMQRYNKSELVATGVLVRDPGYIDFSIDWWGEVEQFSSRDQLSFGPVARKHGLMYEKMPFLRNFVKHKHLNKKRLAW
jgi:hypothetical protein